MGPHVEGDGLSCSLAGDAGDSAFSPCITIRDACSGNLVCRVAATPPAAGPTARSRREQLPAGKLAEEVLEVVKSLGAGQPGVLMDGIDVSKALVYTRSDRLQPGTYFLHTAGPNAPDKPAQPTWKEKLAATVIALVTLGFLMQSALFMLAVPSCGCNWNCIQHWYKAFIGHIDGPFKIFTFAAAIQRAAANPSLWLNGIQKVTRTIARMLQPEPASHAPAKDATKKD